VGVVDDADDGASGSARLLDHSDQRRALAGCGKAALQRLAALQQKSMTEAGPVCAAETVADAKTRMRPSALRTSELFPEPGGPATTISPRFRLERLLELERRDAVAAP
jgi:hypothetical protein